MGSKHDKRTIKQNVVSTCEEIPNLPATEILDWMLTRIETDEPVYLLAHFDDGVVWGRRVAGNLTANVSSTGEAIEENPDDTAQAEAVRTTWITSHDCFSSLFPEPRDVTLQQARAFHQQGEVFVWRDGENTFHATQTTDRPTSETHKGTEHLDETQMLWGNKPEGRTSNGFQLWRDGAQGLLHALPQTTYWLPTRNRATNGDKQQVKLPPLLLVRHYLADDPDEPAARIERSRIVGFHLPAGEETEIPEEASEDEEDIITGGINP